ncbi:MAG: AraC family transcriptional regulator [Lysobacterales bacterium]
MSASTPNSIQNDDATPLARRLDRWTQGTNRLDTAIPGLSLHRWEHPTEPTSYMLAPSVCLIGQGRKQVVLGEERFVYDAQQFLITSIDLPVISHILEASPERPYLGMMLEVDLRTIAKLVLAQEQPVPRSNPARLGIAVSRLPPKLSDAMIRLLDLLDSPEDIPALAPLLRQEIGYRLLHTEQGPQLRRMAATGHHGFQISRAIDWLKHNLAKPMRVDDLASKSGLSASAFHNHFRAITAMSPLQYQKRLRLNEARRLMLTEHLDASIAAYQVGYESPSQFSREYSRQFGAPPLRDIRNLLQVSLNQPREA